MRGERMAKKSSFGSIVRKRMSDITNLQSQPKPSGLEEKPHHVSPAADDYIDQLIKEKLAMMKVIEERNKIIELSGTELQKLRICFQKLQLQNWNLAQSNRQMLAELNLGRDRVKTLQHELVCKDALLKAKNLEKRGNADVIYCQNTESHGGEQAAEEYCMAKANDEDKPCTRNRRSSARSHSMGPSTTSQRGGDKEKIENKRRCSRRKSARLKSQQPEPSSDYLFEIDIVNFGAETQILRRSSNGRPSQKAVVTVESYKEVPANVKMRRHKD